MNYLEISWSWILIPRNFVVVDFDQMSLIAGAGIVHETNFVILGQRGHDRDPSPAGVARSRSGARGRYLPEGASRPRGQRNGLYWRLCHCLGHDCHGDSSFCQVSWTSMDCG